MAACGSSVKIVFPASQDLELLFQRVNDSCIDFTAKQVSIAKKTGDKACPRASLKTLLESHTEHDANTGGFENTVVVS